MTDYTELSNGINIVGGGRIGSFFASLIPGSTILDRSADLSKIDERPVLVATRCDSLDEIFAGLSAASSSRKRHVITVQNGIYFDLMQKYHRVSYTCLLIYFAISKIGAAPVDGGGSLAWGPAARDLTRLLQNAALRVSVVDEVNFKTAAYEKLIWNAVFGLLCEIHQKPVGKIVSQHADEVSLLCEELSSVVRSCDGVVLAKGLAGRLSDYSLSISEYQGALKEYPWRNGWFFERKETPFHQELLVRVGAI